MRVLIVTHCLGDRYAHGVERAGPELDSPPRRHSAYANGPYHATLAGRA